MTSRRAYVETTIVADALLKPGSAKFNAARSALRRYEKTYLPVYAIKEWKAGALKNYAYLHGKLTQTKSLSRTIEVINSLPELFHRYRKSTSFEALTAAVRLSAAHGSSGPAKPSADEDKELADRYRLSIATLLHQSWLKRRGLATETIQDLDCYTETGPVLNKQGLFNLNPLECDTEECSLAGALRRDIDSLRKLLEAVPASSNRKEDVERRRVLRDLIRKKNFKLSPKDCRALGDAIFAFFAPPDCCVLTTNIKDHLPLAEALGKTAEAP